MVAISKSAAGDQMITTPKGKAVPMWVFIGAVMNGRFIHAVIMKG